MAKKKNPNSNPKSGGLGFIITALVLIGAIYIDVLKNKKTA